MKQARVERHLRRLTPAALREILPFLGAGDLARPSVTGMRGDEIEEYVRRGPSWMDTDDWEGRLRAYRRQGRAKSDIAEIAAYLETRGPRKPRTREEGIARSQEFGIVTRALYVPKEDEARDLVRDQIGRPTLRLVDAGDRLVIWSPLDGGALLNPKGPGLRSLGLVTSYARGTQHHAGAFRTADLRKGKLVELRAEPDSAHDRNSVAMHEPGARMPFAYVQRGKAPSVSRRLLAGDDLVGVALWGPGRGKDDNSAFVLIGTRVDLDAMLDS